MNSLFRIQESDLHSCVRSCQIIPPNEITKVKRLGAGSFGELVEVTLGEWLGSPVALKTLNEQVAGEQSSSLTREFLKELKLLADHSHNKVVRFLGVCVSPLCIVLDYYPHGSLDKVLHVHKTAITYGQVLNIAQDVALGMRFLHHRKILHRDLKPHNVLIDKGLGARIADFGLAKTVVDGSLSEEGLTGTVPYMAPEILARKPYSFPVDVYAFAILLNEMIASQPPYEGSEVEDVVHAVLALDQRPTLGACTPSMTKMIQNGWKKRAESRPSFESIVAGLQSMIEDTQKAKLVANSLVSSVSKLVSYLSSKFLFEKEEALHKLRDMMDYGQDLYNVFEVQEAFRIAKGLQRVSDLLETLVNKSLNAHEEHQLELSICEVICNACHSNDACKDEARACEIPQKLLRLSETSDCLPALCNVFKCLKVITHENHDNCRVLFQCHMLDIASQCLEKQQPLFDHQQDLEFWFHEHPTLTSWEALPDHIPGLQEEDDSSEVSLGARRMLRANSDTAQEAPDRETELCESLLCLLNNMHKEGFLFEEKSRHSRLSLLCSFLLHSSQKVQMQAKILLEMLLKEGGIEMKQIIARVPLSVLLDDMINHGLLFSLGQLILGYIFQQSDSLPAALCVRLARFMLHCSVEHPGLEDNWKLLLSALRYPPAADDFAEHGGLSSLLRLKKKDACDLIPTVVVFAASTCSWEALKPWQRDISASMQACLESSFYRIERAYQELSIQSVAKLESSSSDMVALIYQGESFSLFLRKNAQTFPDGVTHLLHAAFSTRQTFGADVHGHAWMPLLLELLALVQDSHSLARLCEMMWAALDQERECRVDFANAHGSQSLMLLLRRQELNVRLFAAACIRAACMNCPENRQELHEAQGVRHLLDFLRRDRAAETEESAATEHALAAINNACCSHAGNCQDVHANNGMLVLVALLDRRFGPKVREYAALAIVNTSSNSNTGVQAWKQEARKALQALIDDASATDNAKRFASWSLKNILLK
eukprot:762829-Hanusia_phi.AAC.3